MKRLTPGQNNKEERLNFVRYWADYVKETPDKMWSKQQNLLIDSHLKNSKMSAKQYLKLKQEKCFR